MYAVFLPEVKKAIEKVKLTAYWEPLTKKYNQSTKFSGDDPVDTDLNKYVTEKAIDGIFHLVAQEEKAIRKDPISRTTDLLKKVFSSVELLKGGSFYLNLKYETKTISHNNPIAPSELIITDEGRIYHLDLLPEDIADNIIVVSGPRKGSISCSILTQ